MGEKSARYPTWKPSKMPASGRVLDEHLLDNIDVAGSAGHRLWYAGVEAQLQEPEKFAFRGRTPSSGESIDLLTIGGQSLEGNPNAESRGSGVFTYRFTGEESSVLVADLAPSARMELGIPGEVSPKDKVYNRNFCAFEDLPELTLRSNQLAALAVPWGISNYQTGSLRNVNYSEMDVRNQLMAAFADASGPEMIALLDANNAAWRTLDFIRSGGNLEGDIRREFHAQNPADFYAKDIGTVLPMMLYAVAILGENPVRCFEELGVEVWDGDKIAASMVQYMPEKATLRAAG